MERKVTGFSQLMAPVFCWRQSVKRKLPTFDIFKYKINSNNSNKQTTLTDTKLADLIIFYFMYLIVYGNNVLEYVKPRE